MPTSAARVRRSCPVPPTSNVQHLAVQAGKDSKLRLINIANMSGQGAPGHTGGEIAIYNLPQGNVVLSQPAVWVNPADNSTWVFVVNGSGAAAYQLAISGTGAPSLTLKWNNGNARVLAAGRERRAVLPGRQHRPRRRSR